MIHITDYACFHEQGYYTPGDTGAPVYRTRAGNIGVAICYDRHYPEYMRALALGGADLTVLRETALALLQQAAGRGDTAGRLQGAATMVGGPSRKERTHEDLGVIFRLTASMLRDIEAINSGAD